MAELHGRVALVTGGSRGIGAAIARRFARAGARVAITYAHSREAAEALAAELPNLGAPEAVALRADAENAAEVRRIPDAVVERFGRLDIVVNNAGVLAGGPLEDASEADFDRTVNVNLRAVFLTAQAAARHMESGGRLIQIGSIFGERAPLAGIGFYSMSKAGVAALTRAWARDLGARGITVTCIQPGPVDTDMNPADGELASLLTPRVPLGRYGTAEEIAETALFLAGPGSSYVNGTVLTVDGGFEA